MKRNALRRIAFVIAGSATCLNVFSQANTALSNLSATAVNTDLAPGSANAENLGTSTLTWKNLYFSGGLYFGNAKFINPTAGSNLQNAGIGNFSLVNNSSGYNNVATGANSLRSNTIGYNNVAVGYNSLFKSAAGHNNTAVGAATLFNNSSGVSNAAFGNSALTGNTTGNNNVAIGANAMTNNTTGTANVAIGLRALFNNVSGNDLVAIGDSAMFHRKGNNYDHSIAIGSKAMFMNVASSFNIALGDEALYSNTSGEDNIAVGYQSLRANDYGSGNMGIGYQTLLMNTSGSGNIAFGFENLYRNSTGSNNTAVGSSSLLSNTQGSANVAVGSSSLSANSGNLASYNTGIGVNALQNTTNSQFNTAIGYKAGYGFDFGYNNTFLGANCSGSRAGLYNCIAIGQDVTCDDVSQARIGNAATTSIGGYANWSNISDGRYKKNIKADVKGLDFITKLRPVTYNLDIAGLNSHFKNNKESNPAADKAVTEKEKLIWSGFVAQDVEKAAKEAGYDFSGVDAPRSEDGLYALRYAEFVVPLVKGMQELADSNAAKTRIIDSMQSAMDAMQKRLDRIERMLAGGTSNLTSGHSGSLEQNTPNPFHGNTTIQYILPSTYGRAKVLVTDMSGRVVKEVPVTGSGKGTIQLQSGTLATGSYPYVLYIDGRIAGSKQMLVIE